MRSLGVGVLAWVLVGCGRSPSPLYPALEGSIGMTHRGVLTGSMEIPSEGPGYSFLRDNDRHHATPRFAQALVRAAAHVEEQRPGSVLVFGDLSKATGGTLLPHFSHRNGRDADLLLYATTLDGIPVASPDFIHYGPDGLAFHKKKKRYYRLDEEREWLLVKALIEDPDAHIQWIFVHRHVKARLIQWARASGESPELIARAFEVMAQPRPPGGLHDDHTHVRTTCTSEEVLRGCEPFGPARAWLEDPLDAPPPLPETSDAELVAELSRPLQSAGAPARSAAAAP
ncbi:penicillin-insensitive murein endopeptidase [Pendulispora rubella]|uniref:Penicillin-insensitive murein endopeptidase n=1 Tax=Pendulispora rubella TaxID=2741070 RepID=A0ABZ2LF22_9BACT